MVRVADGSVLRDGWLFFGLVSGVLIYGFVREIGGYVLILRTILIWSSGTVVTFEFEVSLIFWIFYVTGGCVIVRW